MFSERRAKNPRTNKGKDCNWPSLMQGFPPAPCKPSGKCYWVCKEYFSGKSMASLQHKHYHFQCTPPAHFCVQAALCPGEQLIWNHWTQRGLSNICHIHFKTCSAAELHNLTSSIKKSLRFSSSLQEQWGIELFGSPCWEIQRCFRDTLISHILKHFGSTHQKKINSLLWEITTKVQGIFQQWIY